MAKLRLKLKTTLVDGVAGKVDLKFNGASLQNDIVLNTADMTLEYDVSLLAGTNTVGIDLDNSQADGYDPDTGNWAHTLRALVDEVSFSTDGTTYTSVIPQARTYFIAVGGPNVGQELTLKDQIDSFAVWGLGYSVEFNSSGLINQPDFTVQKPYNPVRTWDGTVYTDEYGNKFDGKGDPIA